jgi:hypothetical protein
MTAASCCPAIRVRWGDCSRWFSSSGARCSDCAALRVIGGNDVPPSGLVANPVPLGGPDVNTGVERLRGELLRVPSKAGATRVV